MLWDEIDPLFTTLTFSVRKINKRVFAGCGMYIEIFLLFFSITFLPPVTTALIVRSEPDPTGSGRIRLLFFVPPMLTWGRGNK